MESQGAPKRDGYSYPLYRRNDRLLPAEWEGALYLWDIDNTYLISVYDGLRDLIRIRFEAALDKDPVPGAVELLSALRKGAEDGGERPPIYFVSASPEGMRSVLEKRMLLDGVVHDGITFRDLHKLRYIKDIFGFKLIALLLYRLENPRGAREILFGDDREHDPSIYTLYTQVCAGALRGDALRAHLIAHGVRRSASRYAATLAGELPEHDPVEWVFIRRLSGRRDEPAGEDERVVRVDDYAQAAAILRACDRIGQRGFAAIVRAVRAAGGGHDICAALASRVERLPEGARDRIERELETPAGAENEESLE